MKKMRLLALASLIFCANVAFAQNITVTGTVTEGGQPLIGAVVSVVGTSNAAATNADGTYVLKNVPSTGSLLFHYVGLKDQTIPVNGQTVIDAVMLVDAIQAEAVVVTALGVKRPTKALGYAVQEVSGDKLLESRTSNVTNALSGKVAGLQIVKGGSGPGASSKIILRGQNSLTGTNQPLIVVDGVPMDNFIGGSGDMWGNQGADMGNGLSDLNPEDIEAMTVLKGASAAALYGSRAGNGVILVTTKSGRANEGLGITVSAGIAIENILVEPRLQNSFSQGLNGAFDNQARDSWGVAANVGNQGMVWDKASQGFKNGDINTYDNIGSFFRTGIIDTESVSFQQQIKKTSVYASINRMNDASMIPETSLNRTNMTVRATTNLGNDDRWKIDFKVNYINSKGENRPTEGINQSNAFYTLNNLPRSLNINDFNPSINSLGEQIWWDTQNLPQNNPWWQLQYAKNEDERNRFIGFMSVAYSFTDWLSLELKGGMDYYSTFSNTKVHAGSLADNKSNGRYSEKTDSFLEANYSFLLIAQKDNLFGKFGGAFTLGGNIMDQSRRNIDASSGQLNVPNVFSLNNGIDKPTITTSNIHRKMNSIYGSLALNWNRAIFLDVTLRNDWSSTMSKQNMSYMYPSVSLSAVISDLVGNMPEWFDFAKVRGSYAEVGNDLSPYQLMTAFTTGISQLGGITGSRGDVLFNPNVRSELVKSWEAGIELRFFQSRLRLDAAWYKSNATRQLLDLPMDASTGYKSMKINAGNIQNQGVEISLGASIFRNPDGFNWDVNVNFAHNRSEIIELNEGIPMYDIASRDGNISVIAKTGGRFGDMYGSTFQRVTDKASPYYGRMLLNAAGLPVKSDLKYDAEHYLGNQQPDALIGFNSSMSWKGITLDFLIDARIGGKMFSMTQSNIHKSGAAAGTVVNGKRENFVVDGVIAVMGGKDDKEVIGYTENTMAVSPQEYYRTSLGQNNLGIGEAYTYDATSVRLRTLTLGYQLPKKVLQGSGFQRVKFSVTANNLWLIYTSIPGIDPEAVSGTNTNATGLELGVPPSTRSFTFNVTLGF